MLESLIHLSAFLRKEIFVIIRQPRLVFSLILGPFFILFVFGIGYQNTPRTLRAVVVVPEESEIAPLIRDYTDRIRSQIDLIAISPDHAQAELMLSRQQIDILVVTPADPYDAIRNNEQSTFFLYHSEIDPFEETVINVLGGRYADEINQQVLLAAAERGKQEAGELQTRLSAAQSRTTVMRAALAGGDVASANRAARELKQEAQLLTLAAGSGLALFSSVQQATGSSEDSAATDEMAQYLAELQSSIDNIDEIDPDATSFDSELAELDDIDQSLAQIDTALAEFRRIDSNVLIAPFRIEVRNNASVVLEPTHFFVPAVISLLLQHLAVTLAGLSIVRERREGTMELFRAAPLTALETLVGKYLSFLLLTLVLGAILTALVVLLLGVPMLGQWLHYALVLLALLFASLGIGFVISITAQTESQAIQSAMIVLLASIFFSGFFLPLYRLWEPVRVVSWSLPTTYGTVLLQNIMLRGRAPLANFSLALLGIGLLLLLFSWWRLSRQMAHE